MIVFLTIQLFVSVLGEMPPGNLTDLTLCKVSHLGLEYRGTVAKTESNVRCQSWSSDQPHKVHHDLTDDRFPLGSKKASKNYCRNPDGKSTGPWCYTMNDDLIDESCALPLCSFSECRLTGPGMEYGGPHNKAASDRKCLKWNKERKKVFHEGNFTKYAKFSKDRFPENDLNEVKKYCRNPDGDLGGPWCFVENDEQGYIEREYCDIPFCYDPECSVFAKNLDKYTHYTDFNGSVLTELKFGLKLWNSDTTNNASARLVLSVLALPLTGPEIDKFGVGIEIFISNIESALRYGNKDRPEYEPTPGILSSTNFTTFTLNWDRGFITLALEGAVKPIFLAEMRTKNTLLELNPNRFNFYSVQGSDVFWNMPFCLDDDECDVHTTSGGQFQQFWPLRQKDIGLDLYVHVRAFHSAAILITPSPTVDFPQLKVTLAGAEGYTKIILKEYKSAKAVVLTELQLAEVVDYWKWSEFSISFFANSLQVYMKKAIGMHSLLDSTHEAFRVFRWFSVSSENAVAHWSFYCQPSEYAQPPAALLPECSINPNEPNYIGTQDVTSQGLPCLPWLSIKDEHFENETRRLEAKNYCRDPQSTGEGTYCYVLTTDKKPEKRYCHLRKCKSELCKMAGTGNDFIGQLTSTRSGRECDQWEVTTISTHQKFMYSFNGSYFAEMDAKKALNYCRNPNRDVSGSWCYTKDPKVVQDVCAVRDCDRPEEFTIIVSTNKSGRKVYILPQWKEEGLHGGLKFSLKEWNPDLLSGVVFTIFPKEGTAELALVIGAAMNEKIELYFNSVLIESKTFPHLISAGVWTDFWLQLRKGQLMLGFKGVPSPLFEWIQSDMSQAFEPIFLSYTSLFDSMPIGLFFEDGECQTENTTDNNFLKFLPIGWYSQQEGLDHHNLTLTIRGVGQTWVSLMWVTNNLNSYQIKVDTDKELVGLYLVDTAPRGTTPQITLLVEQHVTRPMTTLNWTRLYLSWTETTFDITLDERHVLSYRESSRPFLVYWFSVAAASGWVTWTANCQPLDLDGPAIDGGWSPWGPWTCTVTCGGGEGYRTRTCSNPHPNFLGRLCEGLRSPTATGVCNDFPCGDISPDTLSKIRENLRQRAYTYLLDEDTPILLENDKDMMKTVKKQSPEAYFEWTLNGVWVKLAPNRVTFQGDDLSIARVKPQDAGVYVSMIYRPQGQRVILKVLTLAIRAKTYDVNTRATWSYTLQCHAVILGYVYADLSLKVTRDNVTYVDHGLTSLAAVDALMLTTLNRSESGEWHCVVEQHDLGLRWITNCLKMLVKKPPNFFTHIMEDKLTAPIFGRLPNETIVLVVLVLIVIVVLSGVVGFVFAYFKFCHLDARRERNRRFQ